MVEFSPLPVAALALFTLAKSTTVGIRRYGENLGLFFVLRLVASLKEERQVSIV